MRCAWKDRGGKEEKLEMVMKEKRKLVKKKGKEFKVKKDRRNTAQYHYIIHIPHTPYIPTPHRDTLTPSFHPQNREQRWQ